MHACRMCKKTICQISQAMQVRQRRSCDLGIVGGEAANTTHESSTLSCAPYVKAAFTIPRHECSKIAFSMRERVMCALARGGAGYGAPAASPTDVGRMPALASALNAE